MKKLMFLTVMAAAGLSQSALAMPTTKVEGYTLYGCESEVYSNSQYRTTKNYCKKDKKDLQVVFKKAKSMKPNFDGNKKIITHKYKDKHREYITDIFVFDDKNKNIYLQKNYASFLSENNKSPSIVSSTNSKFYCLYEEDAFFSADYSEDYPISHTPVYYDDNNKIVPSCIFFSEKEHPDVFSYPQLARDFYNEYKGTDIEAFVNKVSK